LSKTLNPIIMNTQQRNELLAGQTQNRSKCLVYTRVMGYHRPVESFNIGKKGEHRQRRHFTEK
ncbi:MAG TPA: anaerobic ribonucleoside-triphosphate reductase, partial [Flavobacterium sp.]|nr:anaerobic ribonucleoside-triphosphate reductase [Flavobacterium sp.]